MRQKIRRLIIFTALFLFPLTLNYFSPYVSVDGAMAGIVSGSVLVFLLMFLSGLFFSRSWCGWGCPVAGLSELGGAINNRSVPAKRLKIIRYTVFFIWFGVLITGFILAGGIRSVDPFHLTEQYVSVDEPIKYMIYYMILFLIFGLTVGIGRRGACHTICWMSPFLVGGYHLGRLLRFPQLRIVTEPEKCIACKACDKKCPMSIPVSSFVQEGEIASSDCILCLECADSCPKQVLKPKMRRRSRK